MRRYNPERMTIVEQLIVLREDVCRYSCKYWDETSKCNDPYIQKVKLQEYCKDCPLTKLHFTKYGNVKKRN